MKKKPIPIGNEDFKDVIEKGYYYVDKTLLIKELLEYKGYINLFTRPRRFGKTLNVSMLKYFFEKTEQEDCTRIFNDLKISKEPECLAHMGKYPVISVSFKSGKQDNIGLAISSMKKAIAEEYRRHETVLLQSDIEPDRIHRILNAEGEIDDYMDSLRFLSECLYRHYEKKVIILIDEYDVPLENAYFRGFYDEVKGLIRSIFESALKTNPYLEFSVITGCLRISKDSIFTGLNNLEITSITSNQYAEHFGFTYEELDKLLKYYQIQHKEQEIKDWYDGYMFGDTKVFNPWSVVNYVKSVWLDANAFPRPYWSNTSSNDIVKSLIEKADVMTKQEIEALIGGAVIEKTIHEDITYEDIETSRDNLWNFLFFTGYLSQAENTGYMMEADAQKLCLGIPNREVKYIFESKIKEWFREKIQMRDMAGLYKSILEGDSVQVELIVSEILRESVSYYDSREAFYHGFMIGILRGLDDFIIESNRESGDGRYDICLRNLDVTVPAVIFELKIADSYADMKAEAEKALEQIGAKDYDRNLASEGYQTIIHYGVAFYKKNCAVITSSL